MPIRKVEVKEVHIQTYYIRAETDQKAREKVFENGVIDEGDFVYSHSLEPELWNVTELKNDSDCPLDIDPTV